MTTEEEDEKRTPRKERSGKGDVNSRIQAEGWRKMEVAAENGAENGEEWSITYVPPNGSDKA